MQTNFSGLSKMSYDVKPNSIVVSPDGQSATVTATEIRRFVPKIGPAGSDTQVAEFTLRKTGGAWLIQTIQNVK